MSNVHKFLLQVSGSIAAFKAVALCSKLTQAGYEVEVVLSEGAEHFVGAASFEGLTRRKVHLGNFDEGAMMAHIDLERWADLILLYPASANTIAHLANGFSNTLIGSLFLAHEFKKPYWILPAMNQAMLAHPTTKAHLNTLSQMGVKIYAPDSGTLACGEIGSGRLVEPEAILGEINAHFNRLPNANEASEKKSRILITSGGTREPIDAVRSITNQSTGKTGHSLAVALQNAGFQVALLQSIHSKYSDLSVPTIHFDTTEDFSDLLEKELKGHHYDFLIHAAAVADYSVDQILDSDGLELSGTVKIQNNTPLTLRLKPNPKIIQKVRDWSKNEKLKILSFKLTEGKNNDLKLNSYDSEWIIHNELSHVSEKNHSGTLYSKTIEGGYTVTETFSSKDELVKLALNLIQNEDQSS